MSIAAPSNQVHTLAASITQAYKSSLPEVGRFSTSSIDNTRFPGIEPGLWFLLFENTDDKADSYVRRKISDTAYLCDQSGSWAMVKLSGRNANSVLERICTLDLLPSLFKPFSIARTLMEHLSVIIVKEADDEYLLLSPRSYAQSFLHMILTSIENIA